MPKIIILQCDCTGGGDNCYTAATQISKISNSKGSPHTSQISHLLLSNWHPSLWLLLVPVWTG